MALFKIEGCAACGLAKGCHSPKMPASGNMKLGVFVLAEAPGQIEDEDGVQLVGRAGSLLREELAKLGVNLDRDCRKMNAVNCHPPKNRPPTPKEIAACRSRVFDDIEQWSPKVILLLGKSAVASLYGEHAPAQVVRQLSVWRGEWIPCQEHRCWTVATYHPSYMLRMEEEKNPGLWKEWRDDLRSAFFFGKGPKAKLPSCPEISKVCSVAKDEKEAVGWMRELLADRTMFAVDFETTTLSPWEKGARIVSAAFALTDDAAFAFEMTPKLGKLVAVALQDRSMKIYGANNKFEEEWARVHLGVKKPIRWAWDSMTAAHVLDNRQGITSLKWQVFRRWGVRDYAVDVRHLGAGTPSLKLLEYNAADAMYTFRLARQQMKEMGVAS